MAFKLLRLMRYTELPGKGWTGWHFTRGLLVTPEGHTIAPHESAWWSMLVRKAETWLIMARDLNWHKAQIRNAQTRDAIASGRAGEASLPEAGLVSVSTSHTQGFTTSSQSDVIMTSWPTLYAYQTLSTLTPEPVASASVSASTPCSVSPLMPTSGEPPQRPKSPSTPARPGLSLTAPSTQNRRQGLPQQLVSRSSPRPNAGKSPDWSAKPAGSDRIGGQP